MRKLIGIVAVTAALGVTGNAEGAWLPRAMPVDYAAATGSLPRAMPADYERAGVVFSGPSGLPRAMPADYGRYFASASVEPLGGFDWTAALIGAGGMLALLLVAGFGAVLLRRDGGPSTA